MARDGRNGAASKSLDWPNLVASVTKALEQIGGLSAVEAAFSIEHPLVTSPVVITLDGVRVVVSGQFISREGRAVGEFVRWLEYSTGVWQVKHQNIVVQEEYRRKSIAHNHYRKALQFYRRIGVQSVYLNANNLGPYVWPDFAFDFCKTEWNYLMLEWERTWVITYGVNVPYWPASSQALLSASGPDGEAIGEDIIGRVHNGLGNSLRMELNLADHETIQALVAVELL